MYELKRIGTRMGMLGALVGFEPGCAEEKLVPVCDTRPVHIEKFLVIEEKAPDIVVPSCPTSGVVNAEHSIDVNLPKTVTVVEGAYELKHKKDELANNLYESISTLRVEKYQQKEQKLSQELVDASMLAWKEKAWEAVYAYQEWDGTPSAELILDEILDAIPAAELRNYAVTHPAFLASLKEFFSYAAKEVARSQSTLSVGSVYEERVHRALTEDDKFGLEGNVKFFRSLQTKIVPLIKDSFLKK